MRRISRLLAGRARKQGRVDMARLLREVLRDHKAQSFLEYSILIAVVAAAFVAMAMYVRQAVQGKIYRLEDSVTAKSNKGSTPWSVPV